MNSLYARFVVIIFAFFAIVGVALWRIAPSYDVLFGDDPNRAATTIDIRDGVITVTMHNSSMMCPDTPVMRRIATDLEGTVAVAYRGDLVVSTPRRTAPDKVTYYSVATGTSLTVDLPADCRLIRKE